MADDKKQATEGDLNGLHKLVCENLKDAIENGVNEVTKDGEVVKVTASPALFNAAIRFLSDNDVKCLPGKGGPIDDLVEAMPTDEELEEILQH
jgi:hypothetical protein